MAETRSDLLGDLALDALEMNGTEYALDAVLCGVVTHRGPVELAETVYLGGIEISRQRSETDRR